MKKRTKIIIGISLILGAIIFFSFFQLRQSVISSSFDAVEISFKETTEGASFNLEGRMEGMAGQTFRWSGTTIRKDIFTSKTSTGEYPKIKSLNGEFPLVTTPQVSGDVYFSYDVQIQTPPSGSWAKSASTTRIGTATCQAINLGKVTNEDSYYVDLTCDLKVNYTCRSGSNCDLRGYTSGSVKNVFIPKIGFERVQVYRLENNKCNFYDIYEKDKEGSDFNTLENCQGNLINYIDIYRLEENTCNKYNINENDKLTSDFNTLENCNKEIEEICPTVIGWRIENNNCIEDSGCDYSSNYDYYSSLEECENNLETKEETEPEEEPEDQTPDTITESEPNFIIKFWNWIKNLFS